MSFIAPAFLLGLAAVFFEMPMVSLAVSGLFVLLRLYNLSQWWGAWIMGLVT